MPNFVLPGSVGWQAGILLRTAVYDKRGKRLREVIQPGHSFVIAFATALNFNLSGNAQSTTATDTGGSLRTLAGNQARWMRILGLAADAAWGVVIGTGSTAVAMTDTKLVTQIAEGSGSGQVLHGATQISAVEITGDSTPRYINIVRTFQNNSGAPISPSEAGLYAQMSDTGPASRYFCIARDLITMSIGIGQIGTVQYQLVFSLT